MGHKTDCRYGIQNPDNQIVATIVEEDVPLAVKLGYTSSRNQVEG